MRIAELRNLSAAQNVHVIKQENIFLDKISKARKTTPKYQEEFSKFQQLRIAKNS